MNKNFKDISGRRFGMLTVTSEHESRKAGNGKSYMYWKCICDCGREIWTRGTALRYGTTKSCNHHSRWSTHGMTNSRLYTIYHDMKQRCYNLKYTHYKYYGGRGITICDEWLGDDGFVNFSKWALGNGYSDELTIDRIDTNGNYEPSNCRWADDYTQHKNRRNSIFVDDGGEQKYLVEAAKEHDLPYQVVRYRQGKDADLFRPIHQKRTVTYQGKEYSLKQLSEITGISYNTLQSRYNRHYSDERMVEPVKRYRW